MQVTTATDQVSQLRQELARRKLEHDTAIQTLQAQNANYQTAVSQIEQELLRRKSKFDSSQAVAAANEKQLRDSLETKDAQLSA